MPKTIFGKLLKAFIAVLLLSFFISLITVDIFLSSFLSDEKVKLLEQSGDKINSLLSIYVDKGPGNLLSPIIENVIKSYSENTNSIIWVSSPEGQIVFISTNNIPETVLKSLKFDGLHYWLPDAKQFENIDKVEGKVVTGDFYGLFSKTGNEWATVIRPFYYSKFKGDRKFMGAVYLSTPLPEIKTAHYGLLKYFFFSVLISGIITIIVVYVISKKISQPLIALKNAAKTFAAGKFETRIEYISNDEIGELSKSFNDMADDLNKNEELRRSFIANVSHELRTPMTSIKGFVDGMIDGTIPNDRFPYYLQLVSEETGRLNKLANDILELAKMESGDFTLKVSKFGINELIRRCIIKLENYFSDKSLEVDVDLANEEVFVEADFDSIERVIINLIHNAVKFSNENGLIEVKCFKDKGKVFVSVQDHGIGISEDEIEFIWDRFFKADKSRSQNKEGSGLGLAIVKNIINRHNQDIWVESKPKEGTKIVFSLMIFQGQ